MLHQQREGEALEGTVGAVCHLDIWKGLCQGS